MTPANRTPSMKKLSASAAKKAITSKDPVVLGQAIRRLVRNGYDSDSMYRLAVDAEPALSRSTWSERYLEALKAVSPFRNLERGDRIRAGKTTYTVEVVDFRAGIVDLATGRAKPGTRSVITLMESGVDEGKFVVASPRTATTIDSFQKL